MGMTLASHMIQSKLNGYPHLAIQRKILRCNSTCVLTGKENPSDLLTIQAKAQKSLPNDLWWYGPVWVKDSNIWKKEQYNLNPELPEPTESYVLYSSTYFGNLVVKVPRPVRTYLWESF